MASIQGKKVLKGHTGDSMHNYCWHLLSSSGSDYDGLCVKGSYSLVNATNSSTTKISIGTVKFKRLGGYYNFNSWLYLISTTQTPTTVTTSNDGKNKQVTSFKDVRLLYTVPSGGNGTYDDKPTISGLSPGTYYIAMKCGQTGGCAVHYNGRVVVSDKITIYPKIPNAPTVSTSDTLIGSSVSISVSNIASGSKVSKYRYRTKKLGESYGSWIEVGSKPSLTPTKSNSIVAYQIQAKVSVTTNGVTSESSWSSSAESKVKLRPPVDIKVNGTTNSPITYGTSMTQQGFTNDSRNPSGCSLTGLSYLPNGSFITGHQPKYDNVSYIKGSLQKSGYETSGISTNTTPKSQVKCKIPSISNPTNSTKVTIGNSVIAQAIVGSPHPNNGTNTFKYQWVSDTTNISTNASCPIRGNNYRVKASVSWSDGNYLLRESNMSELSNAVIVRRCPRGMNNNPTGDNNSFMDNFHISNPNGGYIPAADETPITINLTPDNTLNVTIPAYPTSLNLGKFNCYKIEFIQKVGDVETVYYQQIINNYDAERAGTGTIKMSDVLATGKLSQGQNYQIKFTAGYYTDTTIDIQTPAKYYWNPTELSSGDIDSDVSADSNTYYTQGVTVGVTAEPPEILYPNAGNNQGWTMNPNPRIIFKVYNSGDIQGVNINQVEVKVREERNGVIIVPEQTYTATISTSDSGLQYISTQTSDNFRLTIKDIGYPQLEERVDERESYYGPIIDENDNIVYNPLGEKITNGSIVVFAYKMNSPETKNNVKIIYTIKCTNNLGIESPPITATLTYKDYSTNDSFKDKKIIGARYYPEGDIQKYSPKGLVNDLKSIVQSYKKFLIEGSDYTSEQVYYNPIIANLLDPNSTTYNFENEILNTKTTKENTPAICDWIDAVRRIYTEVYRKCYATTQLETTIESVTEVFRGNNETTKFILMNIPDDESKIKVDINGVSIGFTYNDIDNSITCQGDAPSANNRISVTYTSQNAITINQSLYHSSIYSIEGNREFKTLNGRIDFPTESSETSGDAGSFWYIGNSTNFEECQFIGRTYKFLKEYGINLNSESIDSPTLYPITFSQDNYKYNSIYLGLSGVKYGEIETLTVNNILQPASNYIYEIKTGRLSFTEGNIPAPGSQIGGTYKNCSAATNGIGFGFTLKTTEKNIISLGKIYSKPQVYQSGIEQFPGLNSENIYRFSKEVLKNMERSVNKASIRELQNITEYNTSTHQTRKYSKSITINISKSQYSYNPETDLVLFTESFINSHQPYHRSSTSSNLQITVNGSYDTLKFEYVDRTKNDLQSSLVTHRDLLEYTPGELYSHYKDGIGYKGSLLFLLIDLLRTLI